MANNFYRQGSVDDIRCSLRFIPAKNTVDWQQEIELEQQHKNRSTVIKMLESKLKKQKANG